MAIGLKSRMLYKIHAEQAGQTTWEGSYKLLLRAKNIPSPLGSPNMEDTSTLEDLAETREASRRSSVDVDITGAWDPEYYNELKALEGQDLDFLLLIGGDGVGGKGIFGYTGQAYSKPNDIDSGHVEMTVSVSVSTVPEWLFGEYTVTEGVKDSKGVLQFTVAKKSS